MSKQEWPAWRFGPGGASAVFESEADVPTGWQDHPTKVAVGKPAPASSPTPPTTPAPPTTPTPPAATATDLDAHGWPWDPALHAATKSKTKAGLWRMNVGKSRPPAKPGYPLDL